MCAGNPNVELTFSSADTAASLLFENMAIEDGQGSSHGGAAEAVSPYDRSIWCRVQGAQL